MSNAKHIAIYSNLPLGGASELMSQNIKYYSKMGCKISKYADAKFNPKNLIHYMIHILFRMHTQHYRLAESINKSSASILIIYHTWLTKSPILMRYSDKPIIYICHEPLREYYDEKHKHTHSKHEKLVNFIRSPIKFIDNKNIQNSKNILIIANSNFSKKSIDSAYRVSSKVVYPGICIRDYFSKKIRKYIKKKYSLISVGAINKLKNQEYLVRSVGLIKLDIRPTLILIGNVGDKSYVKYLKNLALFLNVKLFIKINISKTQLIHEYQKADIFVYSPISEPFGIVVLEAMASGLPIVATRTGGGYVEILTKKNAILTSEEKINKFSNNISMLLKNSNKRKEMSRKNLKDVRKYDSDIMNKKLWKLINHASQSKV